MNKIFIIILLFPGFIFSQIVNIEDKRQSDKTGWSGFTEFIFNYNQSTKTDWEFSNISYLQWDKDVWSILFLNEINLDRAGGVDFANDGFQHLRISHHLNTKYTLESFLQNQYDPVRKIENRKLVGSGIRIKFPKIWVVGISSFYEYEQLSNNLVNKDFRLNIYTQLSVNFLEHVQFSNIMYFQPKFTNFSDWRFSSEATISISLSSKLFFRNSFIVGYDSCPAFEVPNTICQIKNSVRYKF